MPFTASHAVFALAFMRTPLVPAAIAVGAMTPDLPLFVRRVVPSYSTTHDLTAIALTLVIAFVLFLLWRCVLRPAAAHVLPRPIGERLPVAWQQSTAATLRETFVGSRSPVTVGKTMAHVAVLLVSLAIGIVSHVVWDSFTHEGRQDYAWLDASWGPLSGFTWLQHGSSVVGLAILAVWGVRWLRKRPAVAVSRLVSHRVGLLWVLALPVMLMCALGWGIWVGGPATEGESLAGLSYLLLPPVCAVWALLTVVLCASVVVRLRSRTSH